MRQRVAEAAGSASEVASLRRRVDQVESTLAIQSLKATYGDLVDQRFSMGAVVPLPQLDAAVDAIVSLFTDDAVWDGGPVLGTAIGRAAIAERLRHPTLVFSRHLFVKPRILVEGDAATARWDLLCPCKTSDGRSWWMCGVEDDVYRRSEGVWRHHELHLTTVFMSPADEGFARIFV